MFFVKSFNIDSTSIVAYSQWKEGYNQSKLSLCYTQQHLKQLIESGAQGSADLEEVGSALPAASEYEAVDIRGSAAKTLSGILYQYSGITHSVIPPLPAGEVTGSYGPGIRNDRALFIWMNPQHECHVAIVSSKVQAIATVQEMVEWLRKIERDRLLRKISEWDLPNRSDTTVQQIEGFSAYLIHRAAKATALYGAEFRH